MGSRISGSFRSRGLWARARSLTGGRRVLEDQSDSVYPESLIVCWRSITADVVYFYRIARPRQERASRQFNAFLI